MINLREIIVDNFAGGGGASTGIEMAIGRSVDIAINHDQLAIAMHKANHPTTKHYCEDVWHVDPVEAVAGRKVALAWFSPDCKHFSKAKGGKPVEKKIRGLAWVTVKWAIAVKPRILMLENVEEFVTWGPLDGNGYPIKERKGETFKAFIAVLTTGLKDETHPAWPEIEESLGKYFSRELLEKGLGYKVEYRELRACDYGAPTSRNRFFLIAKCDGKPIVWPKPTHGDPESKDVKSGKLKPWRTAAEIIDWSLPVRSIFERKKPLAENTMRRIALGTQKFVINNPQPFIVQVNYSGAKHHYCRPVNKPLSTITTKNGWGLVAAFLSKYHGETSLTRVRGQEPVEPIRTIDTANRFSLVTSHLVKLRGTNLGQPLTEPLQTVTAGGNHFGEVRAFLLKYYGTNIGQACNEPLQTITTKHRFGLVTIHGQDYQIVDICMRMLEPYELFAGQGFPDTYIIDRDHEGHKYPKAAQVARCGNAVPPPLPEALTRANLPEYCSDVSQAV